MRNILLFILLFPTVALAQLELPYSVKLLNPKPIDYYYFESDGTAYESTAEVIAAIPASVRYMGMTVNVAGVEYWFQNGTGDGDIIEKVGGAGGTGATAIGVMDSQAKSGNGAVIAVNDLVLQTADATYPGLVSTGAQTFAGAKTFTGLASFSATGTFNSVYQLSLGTGNLKLGESATGGEIQSFSSLPLYLNPLGNNVILGTGGTSYLGIGTSSPNAPLQFANSTGRKIVLLESANNDHQIIGLGLDATNGYLKYQLSSVSDNHIWYAGTSSTTSNELLRLTGTGIVKFPTSATQRKIMLFETANNDHQYYGFGIGSSILQYKVSATTADHVFYAGTSSTTSNELMRLTGTGSLGIGVTPDEKIHVYNSADGNIAKFQGGSATFSTILSHDGNGSKFSTNASRGFIFAPNSTSQIYISSGGSLGVGLSPLSLLHVRNTADGNIAQFEGGASGFSTIISHTASGSKIATNGARGFIFSPNGSDLFTFSTAGVGTATDWVATSDRRLKYNFKPVDSQLSKIRSIAELVTNYDRKDNGKNETGFVAQELLEVAPEYVNAPTDTTSEYFSVNYAKMVVPLYDGVDELHSEVEALRKEVAELKAIVKEYRRLTMEATSK